MITFKRYLTENKLAQSTHRNVVAQWSSTLIKSEDELEDALDKYAAHNKKATALWRGFAGTTFDASEAGYILDTGSSHRVSRSSNNAYQAIMGMAPGLTDVPSRTTALICTTSKRIAASYSGAASPKATRVVPFDGTVIAWMHNGKDAAEDVLYSDTDVKFMGVTFRMLSTLSEFIGNICFYFKHIGNGDSHAINEQNLHDVAAKLKSMPAEQAALIIVAAYYATDEGGTVAADGEALNWIGSFPHQELPDELITLADYNISGDCKKLCDWTLNHSDPLMDAINAITPEAWNIHLSKNINDIPYENVECWFSGKSIIIPFTSPKQ